MVHVVMRLLESAKEVLIPASSLICFALLYGEFSSIAPRSGMKQ